MKHLHDANEDLKALLNKHRDAFQESDIEGYLIDALSDHQHHIRECETAALEYAQDMGWVRPFNTQEHLGTWNKTSAGVK